MFEKSILKLKAGEKIQRAFPKMYSMGIGPKSLESEQESRLSQSKK